MGLCDVLEDKLGKEREDSEKLMEAVVKGCWKAQSQKKRNPMFTRHTGSGYSIEVNKS